MRLSRVLPTIQVAITAVLTIWADRVDSQHLHGLPPIFVRMSLYVFVLRRMWRGVNAPTFPMYFASGPNRPEVLGLGVGEILYLIGVAILWFLVGRFLDRWRGMSFDAVSSKRRIFTSALILAWAAFLLVSAILIFPNFFPETFNAGRVVRADALVTYALQLLWALALIAFSLRELVRCVQQMKTSHRSVGA